jgi:hypothetical protein
MGEVSAMTNPLQKNHTGVGKSSLPRGGSGSFLRHFIVHKPLTASQLRRLPEDLRDRLN